jgi:hypothetical protein
MAASIGEIIGGFVIRPVRLMRGEEIEREQAAYRKFAFGLIDVPGVLLRTNTRLAWTTLWLVKSIRKDEVAEVSLHRKWGLGPFGHWSLRIKSRSRTDFFRFRPSISLWPSWPWGQAREKEAARRWDTTVEYWATH